MKEFDSYIKHLKNLISFRSVKGEPEENMPFGKEVYFAYKYFMDLATEFGFNAINYDNYIGEIIFGEGEEIGIIGHLDVVPEGNGWETNPFTLTERDNNFYGRGVLDDKGPLLLNLFALKELKDEGVKFNKKIRLFVGTNEETDWADIEYFNRANTFPKYGFSPDGNFPVVYAEKGLNKVTFKLPKFKNFTEIIGGTVFNAVCGRVEVKARNAITEEELKEFGLILEGDKIISIGKSCHGSRPQLGKNAIKPLFEYLLSRGEDVKSALDYLLNDKAGLSKIRTEQGEVTLSANIIEEKEDCIEILCDVRVPAPKTLDDLLPIFDTFGLEYNAVVHRSPLLVDKNDDFVKTLLKSYNDATNDNLCAESMSGGTFAYVFKKGCAFGPEFPNMDGGIHEAGEHVSKDNLLKMFEIYKSAIKMLVK